MKRSNLAVIISVSIFTVMLLGISVLASMREITRDTSSAILSDLFDNEARTYEYQITESIDGINVNIENGSLTIDTYNKDFITVIATIHEPARNHSELDYRIKNDMLILTNAQEQGIPLITKNDLGIDCEIYIPRDILDSGTIKINTENMNVVISSLDIKELTVETLNGDVLLDRIGADYISVHTTSGNIETYQLASEVFETKNVSGETDVRIASDDISMETASGNVTVNFDSLFARADFDSVSGDLVLIIPDNDGLDVFYKTSSGTFVSEYSMVKKGAHYYYGDTTIPLVVQTTSGSLLIEKY